MRFTPNVYAWVLVGALPLAACTVILTPPESLPENWVPEITPSPLDPDLVDSPLGFTPEEQSAIRIRATTCEGVSNGSGFILDDHTIVTNRHVIEDYLTIEISTSDGRDIGVATASTSFVADVGVVTTVEALEPAMPLADGDPEAGESLTVVGYPNGEELTTTFGTVLSRTSDTLDFADHVFIVSAKVEHGSSGSAAYNENGDVFGLVYAGQDDTGFGYIIPISIVNEALDSLDPIQAVPECVY